MRAIIGLFRLGVFLICLTLLTPLAAAQNFQKYRDFDLGMSVAAVVKQTEAAPGSAKTLVATPALVQTLQWSRQGYFSSSVKTDPVRTLRFDFYDDKLFKIIAVYGSRELEGMTVADLIEAISRIYGSASTPDDTINISAKPGYEDRQKVLARWENEQISYSLFRSSYGGEFGLIALSKAVDGMAALSIREGERLAAIAAPQLEIERQQKAVEERRILQEKARNVNVPNFLP